MLSTIPYVIRALVCLLACVFLSAAFASDRTPVLAWVEVVETDGRFPLLADGARGAAERKALMEAVTRSGISLRLPRVADAYQLGHVATETDGALAPLRRMAGDGILLVGTLTRRPDGHWDGTWTLEDLRASKENPKPTTDGVSVERAGLDAAMQAGTELAARILADKP